MLEIHKVPQLQTFTLRHFKIETLLVNSQALKGNPLGDSPLRHSPVLVPNEAITQLRNGSSQKWPTIFVLAGFTGNSPFYFNSKFNEPNAVQIIDQAVHDGLAPLAFYVFVDAMTSWGGSQFINSAATGDYETYIIDEILPGLQQIYPVSSEPQDRALVGGSSGGYGALHLSSKYPHLFGHCLAIAPDCFFEASLKSEFYVALPYWEKMGSAKRVLEDVRNGRIQKQKQWHSLLNAFGMAACYSPMISSQPNHRTAEFEYPLESHSGALKKDVWEQILTHDPIHFLADRIANLQKLQSLYLDVGNKDNFHLQYGARQIVQILQQANVDIDYSEFDGNHFDIGDRRTEAWKYLATKWRG